MSERDFINQVLVLASQAGMRLSRNNCGRLQDKRGRYVTFGVFSPGGSDLIGFTPITITPEMVGSRVAVFTALELKCGVTRLTGKQRHFIKTVREAGGFASVVHDKITSEELRVLTTLPKAVI